jgi:hypothetical protein
MQVKVYRNPQKNFWQGEQFRAELTEKPEYGRIWATKSEGIV